LYYDELKQGDYPNGVIQPGDPQLINVCSYPSSSPTSNQKDCVVLEGAGFLVVNKWTNQAQGCPTYTAYGLACGGNNGEAQCTLFNCTVPKTTWNFTYTSGVMKKNATVFGWGWTPLTTLAASTYNVSEGNLPAGWIQVGFRCVDNQTNAGAVVISSGQTLVCYFVNFFGDLATFEATYGPVSQGNFGNITLDEYIPPRTYSPTPVPAPTAACPLSLAGVFTSCDDSDFAAGAACSNGCVAAVNTLQTEFSGLSVATQDSCLGNYNTNNGLLLSTATMNVISGRITATPAQPICTNGNALPPPPAASAAHRVVGSVLLTLLYLFY
jgi:hypothetical protein